MFTCSYIGFPPGLAGDCIVVYRDYQQIVGGCIYFESYTYVSHTCPGSGTGQSGGGGSGSGSGSGAGQVITNNLTDPCLHDVLESLRSQSLNGKVANIIQHVFGASAVTNLNFIQIDDANIHFPALSDAAIVNGNVYNETIKINTAYVNGSSKEYAAILMVHEILHCYMNYNNQYQYNQLKQHQEMAVNYVDDLRGLLQQLYSSPKISDDDANALILNGLGDIFLSKPAYWQELLTKYKTDNLTITLTRDLYKTGAAGYGHKCN